MSTMSILNPVWAMVQAMEAFEEALLLNRIPPIPGIVKRPSMISIEEIIRITAGRKKSVEINICTQKKKSKVVRRRKQ